MAKNTKFEFRPSINALWRFIRVSGAGVIAFLIGVLAPLNTAESLLIVALLVALDKYFRDKGIYSTAKKIVIK